jgi:hypothetical protein
VSVPLHAEELDVNGAAEVRIEEHVPAGVAIVVIDVDTVAIPFPVAAARNVLRRDDPIGLVVEDDVPCARIEATDDNDTTNVRVTAERVIVAGAKPLAIVIPIIVVVTVVMLVPAFVLAVVVAVAVVIIAVLVPALVFAVVVVLRAGRASRREGKYERCGQK